MVQYLIGRAGYGKTRTIYRQIKETMQKHPAARCILIVPELFTLQAERDLIEYLQTEGLLQAEVLSFESLSRRILEDVGAGNLVLLSPLGKQLLLKKILLENPADFKLYGQASGQSGMLERLQDTLEELQREGITPEDLREMAEKQEAGIFGRKLQDLALLQEKLEAFLQETCLDSEARHRLVLSSISRCTFLQNSFIWIDGFSGFSTPDLQLMEKLFAVSQDVVISLTMDLREKTADRELFDPIRYNWEKIRRHVRKAGAQEGKPVFLSAPIKSNKPASLRHLERKAFAFPLYPWKGKAEEMKIYEAETPYDEVEAAARQILAWAGEKQFRWKDIGLAVFQLDTYAPIIERVFRSYGIPGFISRKRTLLHQPLVQFLLSTLDSARKNLRFEDVFAAFKTGLGLFETSEYEELENYCLAWGIEGRRWKHPFTAGEPENLEQLNQWREEFLQYTSACFPTLQKAETYEEFTRGLYQCIEFLQIREKISVQLTVFSEQGQVEAASQLEQTWKYAMEMMDQMVEILGKQPVTAAQYAQVLQAGFAAAEIGILPSAQDQVTVGDMQQSLMPEMKALWVMGFHDGVLPSSGNEKGVLLPAEKEIFRENGRELDLAPELKVMQEYYHVYQTLSRAREQVLFSCALSDGAGSGRKMAVFLEQICKIFPDMPRVSFMQQGELPFGSTAIFPLLTEQLCRWRDGEAPEESWQQIYRWYQSQPLFKEKMRSTEQALFHTNQPKAIQTRLAQKLYGRRQVVPVSISRMESYARCPFSQLIQYGLRPKERREFSMQAPDIGDYMHLLLERYGRSVEKKRLSWQEIQKQECETILQEVLQEIPADYGGGIFEATHGARYLQRRLNQMFALSAWMLTCQIGRGDYTPRNYELQFGRNKELPPIEIELEDGRKLLLEGRIDRLDLYEKDEQVWLRVIDYKTGIKDFQLSDLYYGIGIQLTLYAAAILQGWAAVNSKAARLAGMFFFHLDDPWTEEEADKLKKFRLKGLLMEDMEVIRSMDHALTSGKTSDIIPAGILKNEGFSASTSALPEKDMQLLLDYVRFWLKKNGQDMLNGKCSVYPATDGKGNTACMYCRYHAVCQFDLSLADNQYHWLYKLDDQTVLEKMAQDLKAAKPSRKEEGE